MDIKIGDRFRMNPKIFAYKNRVGTVINIRQNSGSDSCDTYSPPSIYIWHDEQSGDSYDCYPHRYSLPSFLSDYEQVESKSEEELLKIFEEIDKHLSYKNIYVRSLKK